MKTAQTHLVVIDDDLDVQEMVTAFFKTKDFKITRFSDAESALKASHKVGHTWDVVLTDLKLPGLSGVEFTKEIKQTLMNLPIILITTTRSADVALEAVKLGAYDFIVKPIHFPQLQISVERALHLKTLHGDLDQLRSMVKVSHSNRNQIIGKSAGAMIRERIMLEAKRMLVNSDLMISQIAAALQFEDNAYFTRFFKKHLGTSPEAFRNTHLNKKNGKLSTSVPRPGGRPVA